MRWQIVQNKRKIATQNMEGHKEYLEMSGELVSGIVHYSVYNGILTLDRDFVFPFLRIQPNDTHGSYIFRNGNSGNIFENEIFDRVEIDGNLTFYSHVGDSQIIRKLYPSATIASFYEDIVIKVGSSPITPKYDEYKRLETKLGCEGYIYCESVASIPARTLTAGETFSIRITYRAHLAVYAPETEDAPYEKRMKRINELHSEFDLTTGNDIIDTEFAFAKLHAGECLFRTKKGLIHCPGGYSYYAAVWCNDQAEYAAPWFAFTGDKKALEASETSYRWYEPFFNDEYLPIPCSIVAEGYGYWNGAGDRGDSSMYLFGLSRYLLTTGKEPDAGQANALKWCVEYISRKLTPEGVVFSDRDELEGRISTGINLATSSLAYGGLCQVAYLWEKLGDDAEASKAKKLAEALKTSIETYFGKDVSGYKTYDYHKNCGVIRAWNCLPIYMGIMDRADETIRSIDEKLWFEKSCRTTEGEGIVWDRSALYFIATMFRAGKTEAAFEKLLEYSSNRLLGERVPYPIEAYPEGQKRHLSAESALYCRIITDGLLQLKFSRNGVAFEPKLPSRISKITVKNAYINGEYKDLEF